MEFLSEYGLFFAKAVTVVVSIIIIIVAIASQAAKNKLPGVTSGHIDVKNINKQFDDFEDQIKKAVLSDFEMKALHEEQKKVKKAEEKEFKKRKKNKEKVHDRSRIFVLDFDGDVKASAVEQLRQEISAILTVANKDDEVVVNVESPGGMVHTYGLAASQLKRIRSAEIPLTICVDKVAASGGYLMACVANKIVAAPFAIVGSIGVLAQIPNFNRALKKFDVDYEVMTAGEHKASITMFGEITEKGKNKLKEELEETHVLFKDFITEHRPQVPIKEVATGEVWYGQRALDHQLVDEISTSDDYLLKRRKDNDIFQVAFVEKQTLQDKLNAAIGHGASAMVNSLFQRNQEVNISKDIC